jgi:hypothetical protein
MQRSHFHCGISFFDQRVYIQYPGVVLDEVEDHGQGSGIVFGCKVDRRHTVQSGVVEKETSIIFASTETNCDVFWLRKQSLKPGRSLTSKILTSKATKY